MTVLIDEKVIQNAIETLDNIKEVAVGHAVPFDPAMNEWGPVFVATEHVAEILQVALIQTKRQSLCPFCHYQEGTKLIPYVGHYRDPELQDHVKAFYCGHCGRYMGGEEQ